MSSGSPQEEKKMKKRLISIVVCLCLLVSMLPAFSISAFAGTYNGDTYISNSPTDLPAEDGDTVWSGPEVTSTCDKTVHIHTNSNCYELTCGGLSLLHWFHRDSCYDKTTPICGLQEHQHNEAECTSVYTWTAVDKSQAQWRTWWPLYWGYDTGSDVTDLSAIESIKAGSTEIDFASGIVDSEDAFASASATSGDVFAGVTVDMKEGYYVTSYRFVCGNHEGCHTTSHSERTHTANSAGNYTSEFVFYPSTEVFNHWNAGDISTNEDSRYYMPWDKPTGDDIFWTFDNGSNVNYPFYLLLEVQKDETVYTLNYEWGELSNEMTENVPAGVSNMVRNGSHTVSAPSDAAIAEALSKGYAFAGWQVIGAGYDADAIVAGGNIVTNYGSDITLRAVWVTKNMVTYSYAPGTPDNAPQLPSAQEYTQGNEVDVEDEPVLTGYIFTGWTTQDVAVNDGKFTMPNNPVNFIGGFTRDDTQTKDVSYTVRYRFNNEPDPAYPEQIEAGSVWVNDPAQLPWKTSYIIDVNGWEYHASNPIAIPDQIADGTVITLYYTKENPDIDLEKSVAYEDGAPVSGKVKVGDTLIYTITVENRGNGDAANVRVDDWLDGAGTIQGMTGSIQPELTTNENGSAVNRFVIASLPAGGSVSIRYSYTVVAEDAGKLLTNVAYHYDPNNPDDEDGDVETVEVQDQYTLTVEHYLDGTLDDIKTEEFTMNEGSSWNIIVGDTNETCTYNAPGKIGQYAFDDPATTNTLSGTLNADVVVKLYYATDVLPIPEGDDIPDKYQMLTYYKSEEGGTITGVEFEISTIYATDEFIEGDYAEQGYAKINGSVVETEAGYEFAHWHLSADGNVTLHLEYDEDLTDENIVYEDAKGGTEYTFTAIFNTTKVEVKKSVSDTSPNVGETLYYDIHVHNLGTTDLTNIKVEDVLGYVDGSEFDGEIVFTNTQGITYDPQTGIFTIAQLDSGNYVNIEYAYVVREEDSGKTLKNVAAVKDIADEPEDIVEVLVGYYVMYTDGVDDEVIFADQKTDGLAYGDATPQFNGTPSRTGYVFIGWEPEVEETVTSNAVYEAIWEVDEIGGGEDGDEPDDIPDKYQKKVVFKVENGSWDDDTDDDKIVYVTLKTGDEWDENGTGTLDAPAVGNKPDDGYKEGSWDEEPPTTVSGTNEETYTYSYEKENDPKPTKGIVVLTKVDAEDSSTKLSGVVFELYSEDGELLGTYTTDSDGKITVTNLPAGDYYWVEVRPAEGYVLSSAKHAFTVIGGKTTRVTVSNTRSTVPGVFSDDHYGYIIGYDDGLVHPEANITRAEVATIFFRLLDDETRELYMTTENNFGDVEEGMWYNTAVSTMAAMGIINGHPDGNFYPNAYITRAEFAAIAARFDPSGETTGAPFTDIYGIWAYEEINVAYNNGWILGYEDGTFKPNQYIGRAEAMAIVNRVLQRIPESKDDLLDGMIIWPDNMDTTKWYYLTVQEATNSHDYKRKESGYEYWTALKEVRDWAELER